ncbi:hypothetical protein HID58_059226 [Brassica napus]|uniref:Uncharacterized protein n=1 Tax=Brassica napus TaxID=3708 RepID=A0ABQ7ZS94_BRANA|nr:hypothetical protein HID58_059226 [Brassica napus]
MGRCRDLPGYGLAQGSSVCRNGMALVSHSLLVPIRDSPYIRAKNVQLVEKDPERAIPLFWSAINAGDRVDSALKDMAMDSPLTGKQTKTAGSQGKKFQVSFEQEATRLLGNLGWALMQRDNFVEAEDDYRRALSIAPDNNKMCNLGICLMKQGRINEAKETLRLVKPAVVDGPRGSGFAFKSLRESAADAYNDLGSEMMRRGGDDRVEQRRLFDTMFGSSSIWLPQPCREQSMKPKGKPDLRNGGYGDENMKTNVNANVVLNNPLRVDAKPFFSSKLINNKEKLKRTRSSSQTMGKLIFGGGDEGETNTKDKKAIDSGLPDSKEFEEAVIMAVLGTETKVLDKKRLKVFQDITLSSISPRA